jgi:hypothetical protein
VPQTLPHLMPRGNHHGKSIMIDVRIAMNQIATAIDHDRDGTKWPDKAVRGDLHRWASCSTRSGS